MVWLELSASSFRPLQVSSLVRRVLVRNVPISVCPVPGCYFMFPVISRVFECILSIVSAVCATANTSAFTILCCRGPGGISEFQEHCCVVVLSRDPKMAVAFVFPDGQWPISCSSQLPSFGSQSERRPTPTHSRENAVEIHAASSNSRNISCDVTFPRSTAGRRLLVPRRPVANLLFFFLATI